MKKALLIGIFLIIITLPTLTEHFIYIKGELILLPWTKLLVHFIVPLLFSVLLLGLTVKKALFDPFSVDKSSFIKAMKLGGFVGLASMAAIFGGHIMFSQLIDSTAIVNNLSTNGIDKAIFPFVALWIIFINPLMEEFFWRGFIFHRGMELAQTKLTKNLVLYGTGVVFALHHTVIVQHWFNWWQFILSTIVLACAGVIFNLMYKKSGSIIPSLIAHFMADLAIIVVGLQMFGFFSG